MAFVSCTDNTRENHNEGDLNNNVEDLNNNQEWPFEDISSDFNRLSEIDISHRLNLSCGGEYLPVRKRQLTNSELKLSNSGSKKGVELNESLILAYLYNEKPIELLEETKAFYKIKFDYKNKTEEGYIIKTYCGNPTLLKFYNVDISLRNSNFIKNPDLLPYCRVFVTEKFHNLLKEGINSENPLQHLKKVLSQTHTDLYLYSLFVGQSERELYNNPYRTGSDNTPLVYCVKNDYYSFKFNNIGNMFVATSPSLPTKIDSYSINKDTLKLTTEDYDNYHPKQSIKLYPLDNKRAFTTRKGTKWVLNDTIELIDISYIADRFFVPETQIGHTYFYETLESYIQEVLPKRNDTYLEHYLE
tara:strand:+ start:68 stop:1141 length:1074 start_codon:yes stop_codon:yes gene_type:complete